MAFGSENQLNIEIGASDKTQAAFTSVNGQVNGLSKNIQTNLDKMNANMKAIGKTMTIAGTAIVGFATLSVKQFADAQKQMAIVDSTIKTFSDKTLKDLGGSFDSASKYINDYSLKLMNLAGISDEEAAVGLSKLIQITDDYTKATEAAGLAADLAAFKQIDYTTAVDIVGKVYSGNTGILGRYGIQLDKNATKEDAIRILMERTKGQAEAYGQTMSGQTKIMAENFGNLQERVGQALIPVLQSLLDKIIPIIEKFSEFAANNPELTNNIILATVAFGGLNMILGPLLMNFQFFTGILKGVTSGLMIVGQASGATTTALKLLTGVGWVLAVGGLVIVTKQLWDAYNAAKGLNSALDQLASSQAQGGKQIDKMFAEAKTAAKAGDKKKAQALVKSAKELAATQSQAAQSAYEPLNQDFFSFINMGLQDTLSNMPFMSGGGIVPQYFKTGGLSRGSDTVPAMLTPGELVLSKDQQKNLQGSLNKLTGGDYVIFEDGSIGKKGAGKFVTQKGSMTLTSSGSKNLYSDLNKILGSNYQMYEDGSISLKKFKAEDGSMVNADYYRDSYKQLTSGLMGLGGGYSASGTKGSVININVTGNNFYGNDRQFAEKIGDLIAEKLKFNLKYTS